MPIGKNALKRVTNNGYSKVSASAPDMENSTVQTVVEEPKKATPKTTKPTTKKAPAAKTEKKPQAPKKSQAPKAKAPAKEIPTPVETAEKFTRPDGFVRFGLGSDLPEYLL